MFYTGISILSASTLLFEVSLLRAFSISLWYHFAFMVVTIAFLGYGASGSIVSAFEGLRKRDLIPLAPSFFAVSVILSFWLSNLVPFDPARILWDVHQILYIALYYTILGVPFIFSGITITLAFWYVSSRDAPKVYTSDLLGACSGPLLAVILFPYLECRGVVVVSAMGGFVSSLLLLYGLKGRLYGYLLATAGMVSSILISIYASDVLDVRVSRYKILSHALGYESARIVETRWNAYSRVDLIESPYVRFAPGLSLKYLDALPQQKGITVDGDNLTAVTEDSGKDGLRFLDFLPTALPYELMKMKKRDTSVFLVEPGGGLSILEALYHGVEEVYGAQTNPLVAGLAGRVSDVYGMAEIKTGEGRSILRGEKRLYDLIHIGVDTQNVASTGLHALTEDYRFTVEAIIDYYTHLKDGGMVAITRYLLPPPREELKLLVTVLTALERLGTEDIHLRLCVFRTLETLTILLKKGIFDRKEIGLIRDFLKNRRFDLVYLPGMKEDDANVYNRFPEPLYYRLVKEILGRDRDRFMDGYIFDLTPSTDDRPFFYHFFKLGRLNDVIALVGGKWQILLEGGYLLPFVSIQALLVSIVIIVFPLLLRKESSVRPSGRRMERVYVLVYFFLIGMGFMFVEISMIQRFILFLDHPEYSFSVVVPAMLAFAGTGGITLGRLRIKRAPLLAVSIISILTIVYFVLLSPLQAQFLGSPFTVRVVLTVLFVGIPAFFMGVPFPSGITYLKERDNTIVPWAWAINGCASVIGGSLAMMMAMTIGFNGVILTAGMCYILAVGVLYLSGRRKPPSV